MVNPTATHCSCLSWHYFHLGNILTDSAYFCQHREPSPVLLHLKIAVHRNRPPFIFISFIYVEKLKRLHIFFREILNFVTTNKKSCRELATLYKGLRTNYSIVLIDGALAFFILANSTFAQFMCSTAVLASPIRVKFNADVR